ncbi:MAG TPA: SRPBCC family protein [Flavisolibacter sp.]
METVNSMITVQTRVNVPLEKVWECWTRPEHITQWCQASEDWHAPYADNDLKEGGRFTTTMAAKDGSMSFDFAGEYTKVEDLKFISYTLDDDRKVTVSFEADGNATRIVEKFEPEQANSPELQQAGWQSILDNFKNYTESI